jgi:hypothetical protein
MCSWRCFQMTARYSSHAKPVLSQKFNFKWLCFLFHCQFHSFNLLLFIPRAPQHTPFALTRLPLHYLTSWLVAAALFYTEIQQRPSRLAWSSGPRAESSPFALLFLLSVHFHLSLTCTWRPVHIPFPALATWHWLLLVQTTVCWVRAAGLTLFAQCSHWCSVHFMCCL